MQWSLVLASCLFGLSACTAVRPMRRPAEDVEGNVIRHLPPSPDDCLIQVIERSCAVIMNGNTVDTICDDAPPTELEVASFRVCLRFGWRDQLRRAACRAGADTLLQTIRVTDACIEEDLDQQTGTSAVFFRAFRLHEGR